MFKKGSSGGKAITQDDVETIIGPSVKIEGDFKSNGNVMVAGQVTGSFTTTQNLRVEERAKIKAHLEANEAVIAGVIEGNITVHGHLEILSTAKITGDIRTGSVAIQQGAELNGNFVMAQESHQSVDDAVAVQMAPQSRQEAAEEWLKEDTSVIKEDA